MKTLVLTTIVLLFAAVSMVAGDNLAILLSQPDGANRIYRADQVAGEFDFSSAPRSNNFAIFQDGQWVETTNAIAGWVWNPTANASNLCFGIPFSDSSFGLVTFSTNRTYTNAQWGYVSIVIPPGKTALVGNPFKSQFTNYPLTMLFGSTPYIPETASFSSNWYVGLWPNAEIALHNTNGWHAYRHYMSGSNSTFLPEDPQFYPGAGALIHNPLSVEMPVYLAGTAFRGSVTSSIPAGWSALCPINGDSGSLAGLNFPCDTNTIVKRWDSANSQWLVYYATNAISSSSPPPIHNTLWGENEPELAAGEAFLCYQAEAKDWVMTGASDPVFYTPSTSTNFVVSVLSQTSSNLTLALLNTTSNAVYIVESLTNVASTNWTSVLTNTATNATSNPLPPINRSGDTLYFRARSQ